MPREANVVEYTCKCGFRLQRIPRNVLDQVPRCLGCGRPHQARPNRPKLHRMVDVRDLR